MRKYKLYLEKGSEAIATRSAHRYNVAVNQGNFFTQVSTFYQLFYYFSFIIKL